MLCGIINPSGIKPEAYLSHRHPADKQTVNLPDHLGSFLIDDPVLMIFRWVGITIWDSRIDVLSGGCFCF